MHKVAIIGCGRIGSTLEDDPLRDKPASHAGAFFQHRNTKIIAACDIDDERLAAFGQRWGVERRSLYSDYQKLLKNERPDIVSIASWTETHYRITVAAASAPSVKAIYCEKPIATNLREANKMISVCRKNGVKLIVGHERRFDSNFVNVKKLIDKKRFGTLKTIVGHALSQKPPKLNSDKYVGGALYHDGTHLMDLILYYGGEAKWVTAFDERPNGKRYIESTAVGLIRLKSGVNVFVEGGGERDYFKFDLDLQFEKGRILIGNSGISVFSSETSKNYSGFKELSPAAFNAPNNPVKNSFSGAVDALLKSIKNGKEPVSNGVEARNALELILSMYKSASQGGKRIYIRAANGRAGNGN